MISVGLDLGQRRDRTALIAVSTFHAAVEAIGDEDETPRRRKRPRQRKHIDIRHIATLRSGMAYPQQVANIIEIVDSLADTDRPEIWADSTGVGRPVLDMLRDSCPYVVHGVTATAGLDVVRHGRDLSVPKAVLIGSLEVALSTRRLHCPNDLALVPELKKELAAYAFELSDAGRPTYGGKGSHDDLVSALALAVFGAERGNAQEAWEAVKAAQDLLGFVSEPPSVAGANR